MPPRATHWSCLGFCVPSRERVDPSLGWQQGGCRTSPRRIQAMPHELIAGLEAGAVVLLVLLLVPKRGVDHLRARCSELHSGRRRWLFEPLVLRGGQRARNVAVDAAEVFELGVPLYVVGRLAEQRSAQLELERQSRWVDSPKALIAAHLNGVINEAELHGQLKVRGLPLPATQAVAPQVKP